MRLVKRKDLGYTSDINFVSPGLQYENKLTTAGAKRRSGSKNEKRWSLDRGQIELANIFKFENVFDF
jgi:hypothetical protein